MDADKRAADFQAKAKEADEQADQSKDDQVRDSWRKIAKSYRELERHQLKLDGERDP